MLTKADFLPAQNDAITHIYEHDSSLLFARPGAGKSAICLTALSEMLAEGVIKRVLVTAPLRVAELVWEQEAQNWTHLKHLCIAIATGTQAERDAAVNSGAQIVVTNHENTLDLLFMHAAGFDALVIDELSKFKGPVSRRWKPLLKMTAHIKVRIGLTGSPAPNGIEDLFGQVRVIDLGKSLGRSWDHWRRNNMIMTSQLPVPQWSPRSDTFDIVMKAIKPMTYILSPDDWKPPPIKHLPVPVELPSVIRDLYEELAEDMVVTIDDDTVMPGGKAQVQAKLQQLCAGFYYKRDGTGKRLHHFRLDAISEIIDMQTEPIAIIYDYVEQLVELRKRYPDAPVLGRGTTRKQARDAFNRWNDGTLPRLIGHSAAMGHGLNCQYGGSRVAWCSLPWSLDFYEQTILRFARRGQKAKWTSSYETMARDTVEEDVYKSLVNKAFIQERVFTYR